MAALKVKKIPLRYLLWLVTNKLHILHISYLLDIMNILTKFASERYKQEFLQLRQNVRSGSVPQRNSYWLGNYFQWPSSCEIITSFLEN